MRPNSLHVGDVHQHPRFLEENATITAIESLSGLETSSSDEVELQRLEFKLWTESDSVVNFSCH